MPPETAARRQNSDENRHDEQIGTASSLHQQLPQIEYVNRNIISLSVFSALQTLKIRLWCANFSAPKAPTPTYFFWLQPKAAPSSLRLGGEFPRRGGWG
jgi:hypothetical protein